MIVGVGALVVASSCAVGVAPRRCPFDLFLSANKRALNALKNRTSVPAADEFDAAVTLEALLARGDDRSRWSATRAARIDGVVVRVHDADPESANCFSPARLDAHIEVALSADAAPIERVIVEVTPPMRAWAAGRHLDWSTAALQRDFAGRRVRVEGWLMFDVEHDQEAENTRPGHDDNWRATAWEIHPVTSIEVFRP